MEASALWSRFGVQGLRNNICPNPNTISASSGESAEKLPASRKPTWASHHVGRVPMYGLRCHVGSVLKGRNPSVNINLVWGIWGISREDYGREPEGSPLIMIISGPPYSTSDLSTTLVFTATSGLACLPPTSVKLRIESTCSRLKHGTQHRPNPNTPSICTNSTGSTS